MKIITGIIKVITHLTVCVGCLLSLLWLLLAVEFKVEVTRQRPADEPTFIEKTLDAGESLGNVYSALTKLF